MAAPFLTPSVAALLAQVNGAPPADSSPAGQRAALNGAMATLGWPAATAYSPPISLPNGASIHLFAPVSRGEGPFPLVVYLHGGSFVAGGSAAHGGLAQTLADRTAALVALVDYRRAPEHPLPAALHDCVAAVNHLHGINQALGYNPTQLTLLGDSAGGWLAANTAIALAGSKVTITRLVLVNPMITPKPSRTKSREEYATGYFAATADFDGAWALAGQWITGQVHPGDEADKLRSLPPTIIVTNEIDPARDEGEAFAEQLAAAGVTVVNLRTRGLIHAAWLFPNALEEAELLLSVIAGAAQSRR